MSCQPNAQQQQSALPYAAQQHHHKSHQRFGPPCPACQRNAQQQQQQQSVWACNIKTITRVNSALDSSKASKVPPANYRSTKASDLELDAKVVDVKPAAEAGIILKHVEHFLTVACQDDGTVAASVAI